MGEQEISQVLERISFSGDFDSFMRSVEQSGLFSDPKGESDVQLIRRVKSDTQEIISSDQSPEKKEEAISGYYDLLSRGNIILGALTLRYEWNQTASGNTEITQNNAKIFLLKSFLELNRYFPTSEPVLGKMFQATDIQTLLEMNTIENNQSSRAVRNHAINLANIISVAKNRFRTEGIEDGVELIGRDVQEAMNKLMPESFNLIFSVHGFSPVEKYLSDLTGEEKALFIKNFYKQVATFDGTLDRLSRFQGTPLEWFYTDVRAYQKEVEKHNSQQRRKIGKKIGLQTKLKKKEINQLVEEQNAEIHIYFLDITEVSEKSPEHCKIWYTDGTYKAAFVSEDGTLGEEFDPQCDREHPEISVTLPGTSPQTIMTGHPRFSVHVVRSSIEYKTGTTSPSPEKPGESGFQTVESAEGEDILKKAKIEGDGVEGKRLTIDTLKEKGLEPKYKMTVCDSTLYFSHTFIAEGRDRPQKVMYVVTPDGQVFCRSVYKSDSHLTWRVAPYYESRSKGYWIGKGDEEHNINLPFDAQAALWTQEFDKSSIITLPSEDAEFIFLAPISKIGEEDDERFHPFHLASKPAPAYHYRPEGSSAQYQSPLRIKRSKPKITASEKVIPIESLLYHHPRVEFLPSQDGKLRYAYFRDTYNRVWTMDPEIVDSEINSFGVRSQYTDFGELNSGAFEHKVSLPSENFNFGLQSEEKDYADVYPYFLSKFELIQSYCRARRIKPRY